ncbi:MAG: cell division protein FtsZ [Bacteroidales bacterium]|nr:cell division protein FtsZ [Bacteroidales bacterium]
MEDNFNFETTPVQAAPLFTFDSPKGQSSYIKVIGVGGGGGNAVNHMYRQGIEGVDFIVCNTDMKALTASPVPNKIPLGDLGLGAGNKPERARKAAEDKADDIKEALVHNTQMLFITAGMGGGTGTGAAPVIAEIAKSIDLDNDENKKILVVAIVTRPFSFEGKRRREQAEAGIEELRKHVDSIIVINNDKLLTDGRMRISESFGKADDVLLTAAKGIAEIITENAYVNRDFQDINTVMEHSGTALMGTGSGSGENRAHDAIEAATTSVLLDDSDISGAKNVLLYFTYSSEHEMTMDEMAEITDYVLDKTNGTADIIWGAGPDEKLGDELKVILIATGFEKSNNTTANVYELPEEKQEPKKETPQVPVITDEIHIITKTPETEHKEEPAMANIEQPAKKRVFVLEPEPTEEEPVHEVRNIRSEANAPFPTEIDVMVDNIHIEHKAEPTPIAPVQTLVEEPVAVSEPMVTEPIQQPQPVQNPVHSAFANDNDAMTAAERIRKIHEMLRYDPAGPDKVQSMTSRQIAGEAAFSELGSAIHEESAYTVSKNGVMTSKPSLHANVD